MMRTLAGFAMRGRLQATAVALVGALVPLLAFLTPAVISLVTLRKGWHEGTFIALWVILLIVAVIAIQDLSPLAAFISAGAIIVSCCVAVVLRVSVSWPATLTAIVGCSALVALLTTVAVDNPAQSLLTIYQEFLQAQSDETRQTLESMVQDLTPPLLIGALAFSVASYALMGVFLARWWQAMLYNPGGFRQEMHNLRLNVPVAVACAVGFAFSEWRGQDYMYWQLLFVLPLIISGLGLAHRFIAWRKWGLGAVVALYVGLVLLPPLVIITMIFGLTDVWFDYRKRFN